MGWLSGYYPSVSPPSPLCCVMLGLGQQTEFLLFHCSLCASTVRGRHRLHRTKKKGLGPSWSLSVGFLLPGKSPPASLFFTPAEAFLPAAEPKSSLQFPTLTASLLSLIPTSTGALFSDLWASPLRVPPFPVSLFLTNSDLYSSFSTPRAGGCSLHCYLCNNLVFLGLFSYLVSNFIAN